jgi:1-acyl-sn-glycerol-3-phosphate acyltransferase
MIMEKRGKLIDVRKVIREKSPALEKNLPGFIIRYLQNILHEEVINDFCIEHYDKSPFEFCGETLKYFNITLSSDTLGNIPKAGGCVLAANHPFGGLDAISLVYLLRNHRRDLKFIVRDELLHVKNMKDVFVGVTKFGRNARETLRKVDELFATDQLVCVFPAGLVSRKRKGLVRDLTWQKTFITRARKYHRPIIPTYIDGTLSDKFYKLSNFRKGIGLKVNFEMLYLADEMFKQENEHFHFIFDQPIQADQMDTSKSDFEWAQYLRNRVYELATEYDKQKNHTAN